MYHEVFSENLVKVGGLKKKDSLCQLEIGVEFYELADFKA